MVDYSKYKGEIMENKNSGEAYTASENDNISKIAAQLAADGGVAMT